MTGKRGARARANSNSLVERDARGRFKPASRSITYPESLNRDELRDQAICQADELVRRSMDLLEHTERLSFIETRARRHIALDLLAKARAALARAHPPENR